MTTAQAFVLLLVLAALASYVNYRFFKLPSAIGLMALAMGASIALLVASRFTSLDVRGAAKLVSAIDVEALVLDVALPFLLFAGALHVRGRDLREHAWPVAVLPTLGVAIAAVVTGALFRLAASAFGVELSWAQALLFGALIAPTDPIAVLGIVRKARVAKPLEATISGEALFNDGIGIVAFLLLARAVAGTPPTPTEFALFLLVVAPGGIVLGALVGWLALRLLRGVEDYPVEIFLTLAVAGGVYALADFVGVSGPLAVVTAGLLVGSVGRRDVISDRTQHYLDAFWAVIDQMLNAVLFVAVGLVLAVTIDWRFLGVALLAIPAVLAGRWVSVAVPLWLIRTRWRAPKGALPVLTWGGLRGAISLALAMSLPASPFRDFLLTVTYVTVAFSILVQGMTLARVIRATTDPAP